MSVVVGQIVRLDSTGRCSHCSGVVRNIEARQGCSLARLVEVHEDSCPGVPRRRSTNNTTEEVSA